ncbi:predicted protein [Sclerotinia sclerotiorum 1980 UF-70]|uniref:NYN domain-containing protein n=1 Tax=Sclerotinia sclerotiorum (strain ATCC 18683 / 1980 / Ss-1) TaxID=665079 RepID=A7ESZ1_SCLS1|nr:predicted protein [Sclerotinia sclerotiorum 1980 UF-70]EDN92583.1 predicted protein [Sclerotinia sclerotiorum 1980 UF-70]
MTDILVFVDAANFWNAFPLVEEKSMQDHRTYTLVYDSGAKWPVKSSAIKLLYQAFCH